MDNFSVTTVTLPQKKTLHESITSETVQHVPSAFVRQGYVRVL